MYLKGSSIQYTNKKKPHGIVGQFPNIYKGNKEAYDSIDDFLNRLKEDIGEPIVTRHAR